MTTSPSPQEQAPLPVMEKVPYSYPDIPTDPETQARRGWKAIVSNEVVDGPISSVELVNERMGITFRLAAVTSPDGKFLYDAPEIHENGGGGVVTTPYAMIDGKLMIGVVGQNRPLAGGFMEENPRGFLDNGETHEEGALRETREETGLDNIKSRIIQTGSEINPNSAFFNTSKPGEGVSFFSVEVNQDELTLMSDEDGNTYWAFTETIRSQAEGDKVAERILTSRFVPVSEARQSKDGFTLIGVGLLLCDMLGKQTLGFMGVEAPTPVAQQ